MLLGQKNKLVEFGGLLCTYNFNDQLIASAASIGGIAAAVANTDY
jgi:hypothetical protein